MCHVVHVLVSEFIILPNLSETIIGPSET